MKTKFAISVSLLVLCQASLAIADGNPSNPATSSDSDPTIINPRFDLEWGEIDTTRAQFKLQAGKYYDTSNNTDGTRVSGSAAMPVYLWGKKYEKGDHGVLVPVVSGVSGHMDKNANGQRDRYGYRVEGTGYRLRGKWYRAQEADQYSEGAYCVEWSYGCVQYKALAKKPSATGDLVVAPVAYATEKDKRRNVNRQGIDVGVIDASGHLAFKLNGHPGELHGSARVLHFSVGDNNIRDAKRNVLWVPISADAHLGMDIATFGNTSIYAHGGVGIEYAGATSEVGVGVYDGAPKTDVKYADDVRFNTESGVGVRYRGHSVEGTYNYSYEHANGIADGKENVKTHMFGITVR